MRTPDEHDDDLEPQVVDAAETETGIETETFPDTEDLPETPADSPDDEAADSI